jgi:hypothetical protein
MFQNDIVLFQALLLLLINRQHYEIFAKLVIQINIKNVTKIQITAI